MSVHENAHTSFTKTISQLAEKSVLVAADLLLIEDSEDSQINKGVQISSLHLCDPWCIDGGSWTASNLDYDAGTILLDKAQYDMGGLA